MASSKHRVGIIGVGFGAQVHVPGFRSEGWDVVAICSRSRAKAERAAADAGIPGVHTDPLDLIAREDVDAVAIITPPVAHHALSLAALKAGKHVLCEKPFAMDVDQAAEMRTAAAQAGLTAMIAHEFRHTPQRAYVKQLLRGDYIGKFQLCTIELFLDRYVTTAPRPLSWMASNAQGGGLLGALGSHYIDGLRDWFGDVATVTGGLAGLRPDVLDGSGKIVSAESDDTFHFTLSFRHGGIATMIASFAATPSRGATIAVMGTRGTLMVQQPGPNPTEDGVVVGSRDGEPLSELKTPERYTPFRDPRDHRLMAFRLLVRDFTMGVEQGVSPSPNFTDGLRCQEVIDAVRKSSDSGRTITLDRPD